MVKNRLLFFTGIAFLFSWTSVLPLYLLESGLDSKIYFLLASLYMAGPMFSVIVVYKFIYREENLRKSLGITFRLNKWFFVAWIFPVVISILVLGVGLLLPGVEFSPGMEGMFERFEYLLTSEQIAVMEDQIGLMPVHPFWIMLLQGLAAGITVNAVLGFGEELGWRGMMHKELGTGKFWKTSFITGVVWGIWHAPIILQGHNYPQHPAAGVFIMIVWCILISPLFSFIRIKSGSVIDAAVFHGSLNATGGLSVIVLKGGSDLSIGMTGLAGIIVLAVMDIILFGFINKKDRRQNEYSYYS